MSSAQDHHARFERWLLSGAPPPVPRDLAVHALFCRECTALASGVAALQQLDLDSTPPPVRRPVEVRSRGRTLPALGQVAAAGAVVLLAGGVVAGMSLVASGAGFRLPFIGGPGSSPAGEVLTAVGTPRPTDSPPTADEAPDETSEESADATRTARATRSGSPRPSRSPGDDPSESPSARATPRVPPGSSPRATIRPGTTPRPTTFGTQPPGRTPTPRPGEPTPRATPGSTPGPTATPTRTPAGTPLPPPPTGTSTPNPTPDPTATPPPPPTPTPPPPTPTPPPPTLAINNPQADEPPFATTGTVTFTVSISPTDEQVEVTWSTADGSATAGEDYVGGSGGFTFLPSTQPQSGNIVITLSEQQLDLGDETFHVDILASGASPSSARGTATIDDPLS